MLQFFHKGLPRHRPIAASMHVARRKTGHVEEKLSRHRWIEGFVYVADEREYGRHFMSNARSTNSSKVLYFAHRKATPKPEKSSRSKENGAILYFAHEEGRIRMQGVGNRGGTHYSSPFNGPIRSSRVTSEMDLVKTGSW